jgi:hypothetical protein
MTEPIERLSDELGFGKNVRELRSSDTPQESLHMTLRGT